MAARLSRESLYERRAAGVFVFRTGLVVIPLWAIASVYLYMASAQHSSALFGSLLMLAIPVITVAIGFSLFVSAVSQLRGVYEERSAGLMRRQPRTAGPSQAAGQGGSEMDEILRRYEQDFGNS